LWASIGILLVAPTVFPACKKLWAFLKNNAQKIHGAFPHWLNGTTGAVIPFSAKDDGADLVETSYLFQGFYVRANISMAHQLTKPICAMILTRCGMQLNGIGSEKIMRMYYTGIGARTIIGI
jgi:hypothetical protein